jgi:hypothetical protein
VKPSTISLNSALRDAFETGHTVNVPDLASEITESLADLIVCSASPEERPRLIAHVVAELGRFLYRSNGRQVRHIRWRSLD